MKLTIFDIELSSPCNARCSFCPQTFHGVKRDRPFMDEDLLDKITAEIGAKARREKVHVSLCGMGENLLRKPLVLRALDSLERHSNGEIFTLLVTNGSHLTPDLVEHEAFRKLDSIQVSFTGTDVESYEAIYGLKANQVIENVIEMNRRLPGKIYLRTVDLERLRGGKDAFESYWNSHGIRVSFRPLHSRGGHIEDPEAFLGGRVRQFAGCEVFDWITFISSDGKVLSCCHDVTSANVIGDLRESTLEEIAAVKREMQATEFPGFDICKKCTDFELSSMDRIMP